MQFHILNDNFQSSYKCKVQKSPKAKSDELSFTITIEKAARNQNSPPKLNIITDKSIICSETANAILLLNDNDTELQDQLLKQSKIFSDALKLYTAQMKFQTLMRMLNY